MNGIVFNEELNKNVVDFDLCNYRIDQVALSIDNNIYLNSPTQITSDIIFTVLRVDDSNNFIQKLETPDQNCYFLRVWNGLSWDDWSTPQGTGSPDGGALSVKVESNDNTISQNGNSVYNGNLRQITVNLSAVLTGYATENWVNNQGFLTQNSLNGYATESWTTQNFLKNAILNITTPDNKTNSNSTINLLNGSNIQITSDGNGNITITSTGSGGSGVTKVSSANDDINVANETTEPLLTLNSTVDGSANKIVKLKSDGKMGAIDVGVNALALNPQTALNDKINTILSAINNRASFQYSKMRFVDPDGGNNNNSGCFTSPWKTLAYAQTNTSTSSVIYLMGKTAEDITWTKPNIDIVALTTRSQIIGIGGKFTYNNTTTGSSVRISGISFDGGIDISATNKGGLYLYNGQIGVNAGTKGLNKLDTGYLEISGTDASNYLNVISGGNVVVNGGKFVAPTITGTGTRVVLQGDNVCIGTASVAAGSTLAALGGYWTSADTGNAINGLANSIVMIDGVQFIRANGTLSTLSLLGNHSIQYAEFDRDNSVLTGTNLGAVDYFDNIGLLNLSTITTATKMLVRNTNGKLAEQNIPTGLSGSSLYLADFAKDTTLNLNNDNNLNGLQQNIGVATINNGNISFADATTVSNVGTITYDTTNINLVAGSNYVVNLNLNSYCAAQPSVSAYTLQYYGNTALDNIIPFTSANIDYTNGAIVNNTYVCSSNLGVCYNSVYTTSGYINLATPWVTIKPQALTVSQNSVASAWVVYGQNYYTSNQKLLVKSAVDGTITSQSFTISNSVGGICGTNETSFVNPIVSSNYQFVSVGDGNVNVITNSMDANRFAYSVDAGANYTLINNVLNTVSLQNNLTSCYSTLLNKAIFVDPYGVSALIDVGAGTAENFSYSFHGCKQIIFGSLAEANYFFGIGNNNDGLNCFTRSQTGKNWLVFANNNLSTILPTTGTLTPVYEVSGITQVKDGSLTFAITVNDTANMITYLCSSSNLTTFVLIKSFANTNNNGLFSGLSSGFTNSAGNSWVAFVSDNTTTSANNMVYYNNTSYQLANYWLSYNAVITGASNVGINAMSTPSNVLMIYPKSNQFNYLYTTNCNEFSAKSLTTAFSSINVLCDYLINTCSTTSASRKANCSVKATFSSSATALPAAVWLGNQTLKIGVSSSSIPTLSDNVIKSYSYNNGLMTLNGTQLNVATGNRFVKFGGANFNVNDTVVKLACDLYVITNTFLFKIIGENCTVSTTTQSPYLINTNQQCLQAQITNVQANAKIHVNISFNNGSNYILGNSSINVSSI